MDYSENSFLNDRYRILNKNEDLKNIPSPMDFFPAPSPDDYKEGTIIRYFVKMMAGNSKITEVSPDDFYQFAASPFYRTVVLKWKISGPPVPVVSAGIVETDGTYNQNKAEARRGGGTLSGLTDKLTNYLEFWKDDRYSSLLSQVI